MVPVISLQCFSPTGYRDQFDEEKKYELEKKPKNKKQPSVKPDEEKSRTAGAEPLRTPPGCEGEINQGGSKKKRGKSARAVAGWRQVGPA